MSQAEADRRRQYRAYLERCNKHRFDELGEFVAQDVAVNGSVQGLDKYVEGLRTVIDAFPDYHWDLRHLLLEGDWLSAHFIDTGTHSGTFLGVPATGRVITTQEFAIYRFDRQLIVEVWVIADNLKLLEQLQ